MTEKIWRLPLMSRELSLTSVKREKFAKVKQSTSQLRLSFSLF